MVETNLLRTAPGHTALVEHDQSGKCEEATADKHGVLRDDAGRSFSAGAYTVRAGSEIE